MRCPISVHIVTSNLLGFLRSNALLMLSHVNGFVEGLASQLDPLYLVGLKTQTQT